MVLRQTQHVLTRTNERGLAAHLSTVPKFRLGDLAAHDQLTVQSCELRRLDKYFFSDAEIVNWVVHGRAPGTRYGLGTRC